MNELKKAIKNMKKNAKVNLDLQMDLSIDSDIEKLASSIMEKASNTIIRHDDEEKLKVILQKLVADEVLDRHEKKQIPFILYSKHCDYNTFCKGISKIDFENKRHLTRLLYVYFFYYDESEKTEGLARYFLNFVFQQIEISNANFLLGNAWKLQKLFFDNARMNNMAKVIDRMTSLSELYKLLCFPTALWGCNFIKEALKKYFEGRSFSLDRQYKLFKGIIYDEKYTLIFPVVINCLILKIDSTQGIAKNKYKKSAINLFCKVMGDPRFDDVYLQWNDVSKKAKKIFLSWLAENDLNLFFNIIDKTGVDSMWKYRKNFWLGYLKYISRTWVFFGREALSLVKDLKYNNYGELKGGLPKHSVLAFQIGNYIFIEWSHCGALRVWELDEAPDVFGRCIINKDKIVHSFPFPLEEWSHHGKENYRWQSKVTDWLNEHI